MALTTTYNSSRYDSSGNPLTGYPKTSPDGVNIDFVKATIATTDMDTIGDVKYLAPVRSGKGLAALHLVSSTDMDTNASPTLNADLFLRSIAKDGTITDTALTSIGTGFGSAAQSSVWVVKDPVTPLVSAQGDVCHIIWKVAAVSATPAQGTLYLGVYTQ